MSECTFKSRVSFKPEMWKKREIDNSWSVVARSIIKTTDRTASELSFRWMFLIIVIMMWTMSPSSSCAVIHDLTLAACSWWCETCNFFVSNVWSKPWMVHDGSTDMLAVKSLTWHTLHRTLLLRCRCMMFLMWSESLTVTGIKAVRRKRTFWIHWIQGSKRRHVEQIKWGML